MTRSLIVECLQFLLICTIVIYDEIIPRHMTDVPDVGTKNVTARFCPSPCTFGNKILCIPPPCPPPACVDPTMNKPTDCCISCPNGPDCRAPDGSIVKYNHWKIIDHRNCTCREPSGEATCN